jgi:hypothetical protein
VKPLLLVTFLLVLLSAPAPGLADASRETIGVVRNFAGTATVNRGSQVIPAATGVKLHEGDTLSTGPDGSMGIIFRDNSTLSLGPESSLVIRSFLFSPADGKLGLWIRISRGTMAYLSGLIGKLAPASARLETPVAFIGIRGTRFAVKVEE